MLIRSVRAEDFMRFSKLVVENLPARGVIGIEGPNESGKSTIGESVLFALFGRTRRAASTAVTDLIRWGSDSLRVEVQFALELTEAHAGASDAVPVEYLIYREIDRQGTNYVKLLELPERKEIATGNIEVDRFIGSHLGFDFDEFQRSFYHDQYDSRREHGDQISFFETATGIAQIDAAKDVLQEHVTRFEREFASFQTELLRANSQIEKYDRNVRKLDMLDERTTQSETLVNDARGIREALDHKRDHLDAQRQRSREWLKELRASSDKPLGEAVRSVERRLAECNSASGAADGGAKLDWSVLESFRDFGREAGELFRRMGDETAELEEALDESAAQGVAAESNRLETSLAALETRRARRTRLSWMCLLLAVALIAFTIFLLPNVVSLEGVLPTVDEGTGWRKLQADLSIESLGALPWVSGAVGVVLLLLAGSFRLRVAGDAVRLTEASQAAQELAGEITRLQQAQQALRAGVDEAQAGNLRAAFERARGSGRSAILRRAAEMDERHKAFISAQEPFEVVVAEATRLDKALDVWVRREQDKLKKERTAAEEEMKKAQAERSRVLNERRECESQAVKKKALEEQQADLQARVGAVREEIELRLEACRLLDETVGTIRSRMGPALAGFARQLLPRLTSGRYRDVKVNNGVELVVFSPEKGDFLSLEELSGGTNEAISLALRIALSEALVKSRTRHRQFVLLDEPFKMMDSMRTVSTLKTLGCISADLTQFLVIQPTFSEEERAGVDAMIHTNSASDSLEVAAPVAADVGGHDPVLPPEPGALGS